MLVKTIAHYEVLDKLGAGGMGVVYRARDTRLDREVAIKALPEDFAGDAERLARFAREAKVLASLNHPHIASIYGMEKAEGQSFLILELVEGETLAERIAKGPVPVREALELSCQVAEALEAAHEHEIVHRDLKPANVKVTPGGQVKVLDFGLAKAVVSQGPEVDITHSPTLTAEMTRAGALLGTAAYMSPEQARGQEAGKQADIWAFGCVLYEMLTGERTFSRATGTDTLAAILEREPDWELLPEVTPVLARSVLRRCLQKDPKRRLHDIADARIEIEEASQEVEPTADAGLSPGEKAQGVLLRGVVWSLGAITVAVVLALTAWLLTRPDRSPTVPARFELQAPPGSQVAIRLVPAISPDGQWVAFRTGSSLEIGDPGQLNLRSVRELEARPVPGTHGASQPFFSPDSRWVGFWADGRLHKVSLAGGDSLPICDVDQLRGADWADDGTIVFATGGDLFRVAATGGEPELVATQTATGDMRMLKWPDVLPGSKAALVSVQTSLFESRREIGVVNLDTGEYSMLLTGGTFPRYVESGHLVWSRHGTLHAVPFDLERLTVDGEPRPVLEDLYYLEDVASAAFAVSKTGALIYFKGAPRRFDRDLVWVDREGRLELLGAEPQPLRSPGRLALSPDGRRVAAAINMRRDECDVWIYDLERGSWSRLTSDGVTFEPIWSPDGERLVVASDRSGSFQLFLVAADGTGEWQPLTAGTVEGWHWDFPGSFSPDGRVLAFSRQTTGRSIDIFTLTMGEDRPPRPFASTQRYEWGPAFSPDGRWVAYHAHREAGSEVFVQPYPGPGRRIQVSTDGGFTPAWNPNGRELFYRRGHAVWAVSVETEPEFTASLPRRLFEGDFVADHWDQPFEVSADGQRFLMIRAGEDKQKPRRLIYVQNWFEELKQALSAGPS